jgi:hypothetical protein
MDRLLEAATAGAGMQEAERARAVFIERGGAFEHTDACFEERTQAFLDWFVLDHRDARGRTVVERTLVEQTELGADDRRALAGLSRSMRVLLRFGDVAARSVAAQDLVGGARFAVEPLGDRAGIGAGEIADAHVVPWDGRVIVCRGLVFHPREAADPIVALVAAARAAGVEREELLFQLLRMRMRHDRYRGIRADKIYRFPFRGFP